MNFIFNIFKGIFIGAGAILPGISSGVLCVILGIYETLISRILHFFKNIKENIMFFLPFLIGAGISIIFISKILLFLLNNYNVPTSFAFIGLILGCIPSVFKQANSYKEKNNNIILKYLFLFFTLTLSIYLLAIEKNATNFTDTIYPHSTIELIRNGFLMSAGIVIPGVSNTIILMLLNTYNIYLEALSTINLSILIPMGIGVIIGCIIFLKIIEYLFKNYKIYTYYAIIGFTIGSIFILFPEFSFNITTIFSFFIMIISFIISYKLSEL